MFFSGFASAATDNNTTLTQSTDNVVNGENIGEILTVEGSSAGTTDDDSGLKELDDGNKSTKNLLGATNDKELLGRTITVDGNTFLDIMYAIDSATAGDTIYLNSPLYTGSGTPIAINKKLTIIGCEGCTLDAQGKSDIFRLVCGVDGVYIFGSVKLYNITFCNSKSAIKCVPNYDSKIKIFNCDFINNTDTAISIYSTGYAYGPDGSDDGVDIDLTVSDCDFVNNSGTDGGAIRVKDTYDNQDLKITGVFKSNIFITDCDFVNNTASNNGGAIHYSSGPGGSKVTEETVSSCNLTIFQCNFKNNAASNNGGAVYCEIEESTFADTNLHFCTYCNLTISYSNFTENNASESGGGICTIWTNSILSECNFTDNKASNGGAINFNKRDKLYNDITRPFFHDDFVLSCIFSNNAARVSGGAIYYKTVKSYFIKDSIFMDNKASSSVYSDFPNVGLRGGNNYINAISTGDTKATPIFSNVTYWNGAIVNSDAVPPVNSKDEAGINITIEVYDSNNELVDNVTVMTNIEGIASYDFSKLNNEQYTVIEYHRDDNTYYASNTARFIIMGPEKYNLSVLDNQTHYTIENVSTGIYAYLNGVSVDPWLYIAPYSYTSIPGILYDNYLNVEYEWDEELYNEYGLENTMLIIKVDDKEYTFRGEEYGWGSVIIGDPGTTHSVSINLYQYHNNYKTDGQIIYSDTNDVTVGKLIFIHLKSSKFHHFFQNSQNQSNYLKITCANPKN